MRKIDTSTEAMHRVAFDRAQLRRLSMSPLSRKKLNSCQVISIAIKVPIIGEATFPNLASHEFLCILIAGQEYEIDSEKSNQYGNLMTQQASVILAEYDSSWPSKFREEKAHLLNIIGKWNFGGVEHVGSTAVTGMIAKPVIDVMFGVSSLEESQPAIRELEKHDYNYSPYKTEVMHWFCKPSFAFRTHHIHLVPFESPLWQERIRFRELLSTNEYIAKCYISLKQQLAATYKEDREAYTENKGPFIQEVLRGEFSE